MATGTQMGFLPPVMWGTKQVSGAWIPKRGAKELDLEICPDLGEVGGGYV